MPNDDEKADGQFERVDLGPGVWSFAPKKPHGYGLPTADEIKWLRQREIDANTPTPLKVEIPESLGTALAAEAERKNTTVNDLVSRKLFDFVWHERTSPVNKPDDERKVPLDITITKALASELNQFTERHNTTMDAVITHILSKDMPRRRAASNDQNEPRGR